VISRSPTDVQPVLEAVARAAQRFCGAADVSIALRDDGQMYYATHVGPFAATVERAPLDPSRSSGRAILEGRTIHLHDIQSLDPVEFAGARRLSAQVGFQASVAAPMLREGTAIGCVLLRKPEPAPFTPRQIELLESFAAQAVIAIENVRLFTELQAKNAALTAALEQQTATSGILQVISQSPTDVQPVFDAIVKSAVRLCEGLHCALYSYDGSLQHLVAEHGVEPETLAALRATYPRAPTPQSVTASPCSRASPSTSPTCAPIRASPTRRARRSGRLSRRAGNADDQGRPAVGVIYVVRRETGRSATPRSSCCRPSPPRR
jgi:hypothetical protein